MATSSTAKRKASAATGTSAKITYTFTDGTTVTGTIEQLKKIAGTLGETLTGISSVPRGYYPSESKGVVKISDMADHHIRRALVKRSKDYMASIFDKEDSNASFLNKFTKLSEDKIVVDLFTELSKRKP